MRTFGYADAARGMVMFGNTLGDGFRVENVIVLDLGPLGRIVSAMVDGQRVLLLNAAGVLYSLDADRPGEPARRASPTANVPPAMVTGFP